MRARLSTSKPWPTASTPGSPPPPPPRSPLFQETPPPRRTQEIALTLICDVMLLLLSIGSGLLFYALVLVVWPAEGNSAERSLLEWMLLSTLVSTAGWFLLTDLWRSGRSQASLPFDYPRPMVRCIYGRRLEILLWVIASHLLLLCLCLMMGDRPFISKLFFTSVVALGAVAARKSIPSDSLAFGMATSLFSFAMLLIAILG